MTNLTPEQFSAIATLYVIIAFFVALPKDIYSDGDEQWQIARGILWPIVVIRYIVVTLPIEAAKILWRG